MRIKTLMEQRLQLSEHMHNSQTILTESCVSLDRDQKRVVEGIYQALLPLIEASLTADQVQQVFAQVEKNATAAGGNRTGIGKGIDTAKKDRQRMMQYVKKQLGVA
jgi:Zn-dependent M32 family carboxypeptidase